MNFIYYEVILGNLYVFRWEWCRLNSS